MHTRNDITAIRKADIFVEKKSRYNTKPYDFITDNSLTNRRRLGKTLPMH